MPPQNNRKTANRNQQNVDKFIWKSQKKKVYCRWEGGVVLWVLKITIWQKNGKSTKLQTWAGVD